MKHLIVPQVALREVASRRHKYYTVLAKQNITRSHNLMVLTRERIENAERLGRRSEHLRNRSALQIERAKILRGTVSELRQDMRTERKAA